MKKLALSLIDFLVTTLKISSFDEILHSNSLKLNLGATNALLLVFLVTALFIYITTSLTYHETRHTCSWYRIGGSSVVAVCGCVYAGIHFRRDT